MLPIARTDNLIIKELAEETLVYEKGSNKATCLNQVTALVWKHCDGRHRRSDLARILDEELNLPRSEDLVDLALQQLSRRNLLVHPIRPPCEAARLSRRDALRKFAVAGVLLPLAVTFTARSARAQAITPNTLAFLEQAAIQFAGNKASGQPCTSSAECFSGVACLNGVCGG